MRARIPLSAFRVPKGKVALTFLLHEHPGLTAILNATDLEDILFAFESGTNIEPADRPTPNAHVQIRKLLCQGLGGTDRDLNALTAAGLWLALNHPFGAQIVRRRVSASLCETDRAHITLLSDARHMWAVTVSEKPVEHGRVMCAFPPGVNICLDLAPVTNKHRPH